MRRLIFDLETYGLFNEIICGYLFEPNPKNQNLIKRLRKLKNEKRN